MTHRVATHADAELAGQLLLAQAPDDAADAGTGGDGGGWQDECGVVGIWRHPRAAELAHLALFALQHRGEESAGIATIDGTDMYAHRGMGLVGEALPTVEIERLSAGHSGIGHVRYSTAGSSALSNAQPLVFEFQKGNLAFAHNGNLTNADELRGRLEDGGAIFHTSSDTEVIAHLAVRRGPASVTARLRRALALVQGGYALCMLADDRLVAARDPHGLRPLALGQLDGAWVVASESCAFDIIGATFVRDVEPGELLVIDDTGLTTMRLPTVALRRASCTFEHIYFARPDSVIDGHGVHESRRRMGQLLAEEHPAPDADIVIGVPDSSIAAAMGYAEAAGLPFDIGLIKSHYIGRTFIQPSQAMRERRVRLKLNPVRHVVEGRRIVLVDDSLVRGTTSRRIMQLLREAGAAEVHVRIASPPVTHSCHYGIDTAHRSELIASDHTVDEIRSAIGADSLAFLSVPQLERAFLPKVDVPVTACAPAVDAGFCNACFTGEYPADAARPSVPETATISDVPVTTTFQEILA